MSSLGLLSCTLWHYFFLMLHVITKKSSIISEITLQSLSAYSCTASSLHTTEPKISSSLSHPTQLRCTRSQTPPWQTSTQHSPVAPYFSKMGSHTLGHTSAELRGMRTPVVWLAHTPPHAASSAAGLLHSVRTLLARRASLVVPRPFSSESLLCRSGASLF